MKNYIEKTEVIDGKEYITNFDEHAEYVCIPTENINYWRKTLSIGEFSIAYALSGFIDKNNNSIKIKERYLNIQDIADELDMNYDALRKVFPKLIDKRAICQYYINVYENQYVKAYILNPSIAFYEDEINDEIIDIFKNPQLIEVNNAMYCKNSDRNSLEYKKWVSDVLERDDYTCRCCGSTQNLEVHHILNYAQCKELRTDIKNGVTLCECCHSPIVKGSFHNMYGTRNNNQEQLDEYIKQKK